MSTAAAGACWATVSRTSAKMACCSGLSRATHCSTLPGLAEDPEVTADFDLVDLSMAGSEGVGQRLHGGGSDIERTSHSPS